MKRIAVLMAATLVALAPSAGAAASATTAASIPTAPGWTIESGGPAVCAANGPTDGQARLSVANEGPMFVLFVAAPDFSPDKAAYDVALSFDDKAPVHAAALGEHGQMAVNLGHDDALTLAAAGTVAVTIEGRTHRFTLRHVSDALDAVARCAGQQTLAERVDRPALTIAGAGAWTLMVTMPGVPERACAGRIAGDQIDTLMLLNKDGDVVLVGGHRDWATWGGEVSLRLSIDGAAPVALTAGTVNNLIMTLVKDPALLARLRVAKTLDWTIPTGHVRGEVAGLGVALDAMKACKARASG